MFKVCCDVCGAGCYPHGFYTLKLKNVEIDDNGIIRDSDVYYYDNTPYSKVYLHLCSACSKAIFETIQEIKDENSRSKHGL